MNKRNTIQRQVILSAVKELNIHATAEQVFDYVIKKHPSISRATVYRNLSQMAESGELLNIGNFYGSTHYDHNCHNHHHFICKDCKKIFDVDNEFSDVISKAKDISGLDITSCNLSFSGLCSVCKVK